jgi:hypothetical protein
VLVEGWPGGTGRQVSGRTSPKDEERVSRILPEKLRQELQLVRSCSLMLNWNNPWRTAITLLFENHGDTAMCWDRH